MKIVYNSNGYGLQLTADEMQMLASKLDLTLTQHDKDSTQAWFIALDWQEFRTNEYLVALVEEGKLSNKDLRITEVIEGEEWWFDTDWETYEDIRGLVQQEISFVTGE